MRNKLFTLFLVVTLSITKSHATTVTVVSDGTWLDYVCPTILFHGIPVALIPGGWQNPGFADGGWASSVVYDYAHANGGGGCTMGTVPAGATVMWSDTSLVRDTVGKGANDGFPVLFRKHFTLNSTNISSGYIKFQVNDMGTLYINGTQISGTLVSGMDSFALSDFSDWLVCGDNVIAIEAENVTSLGACWWVYFKMTLNTVPITISNSGCLSFSAGGYLTTTVSGGTPGYTYQWSSTLASIGPLGGPYSNTSTSQNISIADVNSSGPGKMYCYSLTVTDAAGCTATATPCVTIQSGACPPHALPHGSDPGDNSSSPLIATQLRLNISPNPATGNIHINYSLTEDPDHAEIKVYDVLGQTVKAISLQEASGVTSIDLSQYPIGAYSISLENNGKIMKSQRLVLTKE